MLHWWAQSPLVLDWRDYATSDKPVSFWFNILRCADFSLFYGSLHLAPFLSFSLFLSCHFPATKENLNARLSRTLSPRVSVRICDWNSFYAFSTFSASDERWQQPWIYFITGDWIYYCKSTWNEKLKSTRKHLWELLLGQLFVCAAHIKHIFIHRVTWQWRNFVPYLC